MDFIFAVFLILFCWGCLDYGMKRFAAWRRGGATGPTIIDHERRLKKEIGQYSEQHATVVWGKKAIDHFEKTGKVLSKKPPVQDHEINPISGLPMSGGGCTDASGNAWGYDD